MFFGALGLKYTVLAYESRNKLTGEPNIWKINDSGMFDHFPEKVGSIPDQYIIIDDGIDEYSIELDKYFYDYEQDFGVNLTYDIKHSPKNAIVEIRAEDNFLIIKPNETIGKDSVIIEAVDLNNQIVLQSFSLFSEAKKFDIIGPEFIKIHEYYNQDSLLYDFHTKYEGVEGFSYSIVKGNESEIFGISEVGELNVINQPELFKLTSYKDSTFFDLEIQAVYNNVVSKKGVRVYSTGIYEYYNEEDLFLSIDYVQEDKLKIYPNPADTYFNVNYDKVIRKILIYNLNGREIKSFNLNSKNNKLEVSDLSSGFYILKIVTKGKVFFRRIFIN